MSLGAALLKFWTRQGIKLRPGVSENDVAQFEAKYNVRLPRDLGEYFAAVNGFDSPEQTSDGNCISFWGLDEVMPLKEYWSTPVEGADSYFAFADWSLAAHLYAIRLSANVEDENRVIVVYDYRPITVANSFSEFVEAYLANNDSVLFPQPPAE